MELTQTLRDILVIFLLALGALALCHRLKIPALVGLLLTGAVAGPHGGRLVLHPDTVEHLAEIGVVLLLFSIGLECSLSQLWRMKMPALVGGSLQMLGTGAATAWVLTSRGISMSQAVFIGALVSLSSTAIVLKLLQDRSEVESPHGQNSLAVLIFQDLAAAPLMIVTPFLAGAGSGGKDDSDVLVLIAKITGLALFVTFGARRLLPWLMHHAARTQDRELFLLTMAFAGLGVAYLSAMAGLSLALGAFIAGLILSDSEYSHHALANILPFRDLFSSFFFVSIGMLLQLSFVFDHAGLLLAMAVAVILGKAVLAGLSAVILGIPFRVAVLSGLALAQVGEFSFILSAQGKALGLLSGDVYQWFLGVSVFTMAATPFLIQAGPRFVAWAGAFPVPAFLRDGWKRAREEEPQTSLSDHVLVVGFGTNGVHLVEAAIAAQIPFAVIDFNPDTVRKYKRQGGHFYYGDATQPAVLRHAGLEGARVLVIAVSDPAATRRIVSVARALRPSVHIIARTRMVEETKALLELGADEVITEEYETAIEIFTRVMTKYLVPRDRIERFITQIRSDGYDMFRNVRHESASLADMKLSLGNVEVGALQVAEGAAASGKTLTELDLRRQSGINVLAVRRGAETIHSPGGDFRLQPGDVVLVFGAPDQIAGALPIFLAPPIGA